MGRRYIPSWAGGGLRWEAEVMCYGGAMCFCVRVCVCVCVCSPVFSAFGVILHTLSLALFQHLQQVHCQLSLSDGTARNLGPRETSCHSGLHFPSSTQGRLSSEGLICPSNLHSLGFLNPPRPSPGLHVSLVLPVEPLQ